jgi:pimeloyl-ACP methyl ester carboxylesterase
MCRLNPWANWTRATAARLRAGSQVVTTTRGPVEVAALGDGPVVLVSHGRPGGYDQGLLIARLLGPAPLRFLAVSRPGYLRTPLTVGRSPEEQADAFAALLDALQIPRVALLGVSGGGPSTLQLALRHPDRCWAVVLISALTGRRPAKQRPAVVKLFESLILASDLGGWLISRLPNLTPAWVARRLADPEGLAVRQRLLETLIPESLRGPGRSNDLARFSSLPVYPLQEVRSPTLIVHGTADGSVPFAHAEFAARTIPGAELLAIAGGGHNVFLTHAPQLYPRVRSFLQAHAPGN